MFVSSTYNDLKDDRQAAVSAILKSGHIPAGMELFTAGDKSQMATITRWIDESDVYMLILGGRYGSIEISSGLSYTELEYDYASNSAKPLFAVVINDDALNERVKEIGTSCIETENPAKLKLFREKVLSNISSFFSDSKDIRLCVYESLSDFTADRKLSGWVSASEVEDTSILHDEIRTLREVNETLNSQLDQLRKTELLKPDNSIDTKIGNLIDLLLRVKVTIPSSISSTGGPFDKDIMNVFYENKNSIINGIENKSGMTELQRFLFFKVCPTLQIYDLIVNEKVENVRYRRISVSEFGMKVLAECTRRDHSSKSIESKN